MKNPLASIFTLLFSLALTQAAFSWNSTPMENCPPVQNGKTCAECALTKNGVTYYSGVCCCAPKTCIPVMGGEPKEVIGFNCDRP
jgi:hypothetical protein